jgi:V8-like Glu-specific endopeptidase
MQRTAEEQDPIIGGTATSAGTATARGDILITHFLGGGHEASCTGTLLRNDLVVTARHCITTNVEINGPADTNATDYYLSMDSQTVTGAEVIDVTGGSQDFAFLAVTPFFQTGPNANQAQGWLRSVYSGTDASLVGQTLSCEGYGDNTCSDTGFGTLRTASLGVSSSTGTTISFSVNSLGQIQWKGDSGSTCYTSDGAMTTVMSTCTCGLSCTGVGPQALTPQVTKLLSILPGSFLATAQTSNVSFDSMRISGGPGGPSVGVWITHNWNPPGQQRAYMNHNTGVWFDGSQKWNVFNQDGATMPTGVSFNVAEGTLNEQGLHGGSANFVATGRASGNSLATGVTDPQAILIVTPVWNPPPATSGVFNNHPTGVYFDGTEWRIYNEDGATMPSSAAFFVHVADPDDGAFIHFASVANTAEATDTTFMNNPNINAQPNARIFITHNWAPAGVPTLNVHPTGVWFDGSRWGIFNEDGAAMPATAAFNVWVAP